MSYELWDQRSGNLLGVYDTRQEAEQVLADNPDDENMVILDPEEES